MFQLYIFCYLLERQKGGAMNRLFYQLIHNSKAKRWLQILDMLEEQQHMTAHELARQTNYSIRTINEDIKAIKKEFRETILILGDGQGYHFSFKHPALYMKRKQDLLENEVAFIYLDHLLSGIEINKLDLVTTFALSSASFNRMKRLLNRLLEDHYELKITTDYKYLDGEEASIRQFMYDFYFTLPLYPKVLEEKISKMLNHKYFPAVGKWLVNPTLLNQWVQIASIRINQGYELPKRTDAIGSIEKLANEWEQVVKISFSSQEKAALFLLSLDEGQFINPFKQKEFVKQFSPITLESYPVMDFDAMTAYFFHTFIYLMKMHFQLPKEALTTSLEGNSTSESIVFNKLMNRFLEVRKQVQKPICLSFELTGSNALRYWIKKTVCEELKRNGCYLLDPEEAQNTLIVQKIKITNLPQLSNTATTIVLPKNPEERTIHQLLQEMTK